MIYVVASIKVRPGKISAFLERFKAIVPNVINENGCIEYIPTIDLDAKLNRQVFDENIVTINAPMVGTFYSRPNPNSDAYVKVGDHVSNDTTVCIIEAMKVFNEIPAEVSGRVVAILVDDDEPLEFGKPLFKIDTSN